MARSRPIRGRRKITVPAGRSTHAGLTLVEIITALVLFAIVLTFSVPKIASYYRRATVRTARDQFIAKHSLARATAIRFGRVAEFHIDAANASFWVTVDTSAVGSGVMDTIGLMANYGDSPVTITANRSLLCFDDRGMATTSAPSCEAPDVTAYFQTSEHSDSVVVTLMGKVVR